MESRKRLTKHQSGNRKLHSTETLNTFLSDIYLDAIDKKTVTAVILLDLPKAFDSLNHPLLLRKLYSFGISKHALEWFKSYLTGRIQSLRIDSELSEPREITHGVPQGSILGPALFNIYINDLPGVPDTCLLESFVDDSKSFLSFAVKDVESAKIQLNEDLERIAAWSCQNSLLMNPNKTKLLLIGSPQMLKKIPANFCLTLLGKGIYPVLSVKNLGVTLDSCLSYDNHITDVVSKCTGSVCQINRIKHLLTKKSLSTAINALVFSKQYYCSTVWADTSKKNLKKL